MAGDAREPVVSEDVLIVDDDDDILFIVGMLLQTVGFAVRTAQNGVQALQAIEESMPRLVLLDLKMPVMNGWEFVRRFRERYAQAAPIVVMSAIDDIGRRAAALGVEDWLAKPFETSALLEMVRRHAPGLSRGGGEGAGASGVPRPTG